METPFFNYFQKLFGSVKRKSKHKSVSKHGSNYKRPQIVYNNGFICHVSRGLALNLIARGEARIL